MAKKGLSVKIVAFEVLFPKKVYFVVEVYELNLLLKISRPATLHVCWRPTGGGTVLVVFLPLVCGVASLGRGWCWGSHPPWYGRHWGMVLMKFSSHSRPLCWRSNERVGCSSRLPCWDETWSPLVVVLRMVEHSDQWWGLRPIADCEFCWVREFEGGFVAVFYKARVSLAFAMVGRIHCRGFRLQCGVLRISWMRGWNGDGWCYTCEECGFSVNGKTERRFILHGGMIYQFEDYVGCGSPWTVIVLQKLILWYCVQPGVGVNVVKHLTNQIL